MSLRLRYFAVDATGLLHDAKNSCSSPVMSEGLRKSLLYAEDRYYSTSTISAAALRCV